MSGLRFRRGTCSCLEVARPWTAMFAHGSKRQCPTDEEEAAVKTYAMAIEADKANKREGEITIIDKAELVVWRGWTLLDVDIAA